MSKRTYKVRRSRLLGKWGSRPGEVGFTLGYLAVSQDDPLELPIISAGPVKLGVQTWILGVVEGRRDIFLVRDGKLDLFKAKLPGRTPKRKGLDDDQIAVWAATEREKFLSVALPANERAAIRPMENRYRDLVRAFVREVILNLAAAGVQKEPSDLARSISNGWTSESLVSPSEVTLRHALWVSLALDLDVERAAFLLERAGVLEYRVPLVTRQAAQTMYMQARRILGHIVPAWEVQGAALDWPSQATTVEKAFSEQFVRICNDAARRDIPAEHAMGISMARSLGAGADSELVAKRLAGLSISDDMLEE